MVRIDLFHPPKPSIYGTATAADYVSRVPCGVSFQPDTSRDRRLGLLSEQALMQPPPSPLPQIWGRGRGEGGLPDVKKELRSYDLRGAAPRRAFRKRMADFLGVALSMGQGSRGSLLSRPAGSIP
jgi:hypothetical protein